MRAPVQHRCPAVRERRADRALRAHAGREGRVQLAARPAERRPGAPHVRRCGRRHPGRLGVGVHPGPRDEGRVVGQGQVDHSRRGGHRGAPVRATAADEAVSPSPAPAAPTGPGVEVDVVGVHLLGERHVRVPGSRQRGGQRLGAGHHPERRRRAGGTAQDPGRPGGDLPRAERLPAPLPQAVGVVPQVHAGHRASRRIGSASCPGSGRHRALRSHGWGRRRVHRQRPVNSRAAASGSSAGPAGSSRTNGAGHGPGDGRVVPEPGGGIGRGHGEPLAGVGHQRQRTVPAGRGGRPDQRPGTAGHHDLVDDARRVALPGVHGLLTGPEHRRRAG